MNYNNPELRSALAAEFVLGTLQGAARKRFETLLLTDADLQRSVAQWQDALAVLALRLTPVAPPRRVWNRIRAQLFMQNAPSKIKPETWWGNLVFWRGWGLAATAAAVSTGTSATVMPSTRKRTLPTCEPAFTGAISGPL